MFVEAVHFPNIMEIYYINPTNQLDYYYCICIVHRHSAYHLYYVQETVHYNVVVDDDDHHIACTDTMTMCPLLYPHSLYIYVACPFRHRMHKLYIIIEACCTSIGLCLYACVREITTIPIQCTYIRP